MIAGYVIFPLAFAPTLLFSGDDPRNLLLIESDDALTELMRGLGALLYTALFVLVVIRSADRYRHADAFERLQLTPVYTFALLTFALVTFAQAGVGDPAWFAAFVSSGLMPFAFIVGLTRSRLSHLDAELRESNEELRASRARPGAGRRRRPAQAGARPARRRAVAAGGPGADAARGAQPRGRVIRSWRGCSTRRRPSCKTSLAELRELARGIHPAVLTERGLEAAVQTLVARAPVPVTVEAEGTGRLPAPVESAAYFVVSEGLANVAKYANASHASVAVRCDSDRVTVEVADDGVGGADTANGSGLRGLADRVAAWTAP